MGQIAGGLVWRSVVSHCCHEQCPDLGHQLYQPVIYELDLFKTPALLIIGSFDRTAINKDLVKYPAVKAQMGQYPQLAKQAQQRITGSQLVIVDGIGHLPHIEAFDRFTAPLDKFLAN